MKPRNARRILKELAGLRTAVNTLLRSAGSQEEAILELAKSICEGPGKTTPERLRALEAVAVEASSFARILKGNFLGSASETTALQNLTTACAALERIDAKRISPRKRSKKKPDERPTPP